MNAPPDPLARMVRRAFRGSFFPALILAVVGLLFGAIMTAGGLDEGFDGRGWFCIVVSGAAFVGGVAFAIVSAVRWGASGSRVRAISGGVDRIVWAYARKETTLVRGPTGEVSGRVELGVTLHFEDGGRIELPDDGSDADDLLAWIRASCPNAEVGYSNARRMKYGALRA